MLIGEISKLSNLSRDTIRFYEKKGLIKAPATHSEFNNYKNYGESELQRLLWIKKAKSFGFTLNEIGNLMELVDLNQANCKVFKEKITQKIKDIDAKIAELEKSKTLILEKVAMAKDICSTAQTAVNCRIVDLSILPKTNFQ